MKFKLILRSINVEKNDIDPNSIASKAANEARAIRTVSNRILII